MPEEEKIVTLSDDPKFNALYAERVKAERLDATKKFKIKLVVFLITFVLYGMFFYFHPDITQSFFYPNARSVSGSFGDVIFIFIISIFLIWGPDAPIQYAGRFKWPISKYVSSNGRINKNSSLEGLKLIGWAIFFAPGVFMLLYLLGEAMSK